MSPFNVGFSENVRAIIYQSKGDEGSIEIYRANMIITSNVDSSFKEMNESVLCEQSNQIVP